MGSKVIGSKREFKIDMGFTEEVANNILSFSHPFLDKEFLEFSVLVNPCGLRS